jgi:hypothetical protein
MPLFELGDICYRYSEEHYRRTAGDLGYLSAQNWNECQAEQGSEGYKKNKQHDISLPRLEITETSRGIRRGLGHASGQALNLSTVMFHRFYRLRLPSSDVAANFVDKCNIN